ncbi:MAG TPA: SpoIIE family protein phosphatase [Abditibacteriaceae bacterium]|jgi:serine phosphatase RsbU (regulator of sigma subunit)
MKQFCFSSLRFRLLLLVLLAILPALGLILYNGLEQQRAASAQVKEDALRLVRIAATNAEQSVKETRQLLFTLAALDGVRQRDAKACNALFANLQKQYPVYANLGAIDLQGDVFASARPTKGRVNLSDRSYFRRAVATRAFAVGEYQIGRITGKAAINVAHPVFNDQGKVQAVVYAALDLSWLNQLLARAQLPPGSVLTVFDGQGKILARYPTTSTEKWVGRSLPDAPLIQLALLRRGDGTTEAVGVDGVLRLSAFTRLPGALGRGDVFISAGIPRTVAYAQAQQTLRRNLVALGLVSLLALAAAWWGSDAFVLRQVRVLLKATKRMSAGDLSVRSGLSGDSELGSLAHSFDEMAASLEARVAERHRAEEALKELNEVLEQRVTHRTQELHHANQELDKKNRHMQSDLSMARQLQQAFLPQQYPSFPLDATPQDSSLRFTHCYRPAAAVSGDFFDVLPLSDFTAGVFICDVMGHGVRSALITAMLRAIVGQQPTVSSDPSQFLTAINHHLLAILQQAHTPMFASAFYLVVDARSGEMLYANAGHPSPLWVQREAGVVEPLPNAQSTSGPALGIFKEAHYQNSMCQLHLNDLVMLFTDGVFEVEGPTGEYGEDRLLKAVDARRGMPTTSLFDDLLAEVQQFSGSAEFEDDVCLMGVELAHLGADRRQKFGA